MQALKRIPWRKRSAKAREWAYRSHVARRGNMHARGDDATTARMRAQDEARGMILRHGVTYSVPQNSHCGGCGDVVATPWEILRSKKGRRNQVDLHVGNELRATCGIRTLERGMRRAKL